MANDPPPLGSPQLPAVSGNATPKVAAIYTARQLQLAIIAGVRDIEIRAHLDLRNLTLLETPGVPTAFSHFQYISAETRSIRVRWGATKLLKQNETPGLNESPAPTRSIMLLGNGICLNSVLPSAFYPLMCHSGRNHIHSFTIMVNFVARFQRVCRAY